MVLLFILLLLLAIWAAFKFGGVRKVSAELKDPGEAGSERFRPGGGSFGGGGASGSWGDDPTESDKRHKD